MSIFILTCVLCPVVRYAVTLGAPISIAQRMGEDTLTYLNKGLLDNANTHTHTCTYVSPTLSLSLSLSLKYTGQFYSLYCSGNTNMSMPARLKTTIFLTFFDEPDKRVELNNWHYWYNLQANPNQKAFDIGTKWTCSNRRTLF